MSYTVTEVGDDWVEAWDGETYIDPSNISGREKSTMKVYVGAPHQFLVGDVVALAVRLVARITPPDEELTPIEIARAAVEGTEYQWCSDEELLGNG